MQFNENSIEEIQKLVVLNAKVLLQKSVIWAQE